MAREYVSLLRLHVQAEADPGALLRVLERFQSLNILPCRVSAEIAASETMSIEVDVAGVSESIVSLITAKIGQVPCILEAYWRRP